MLPREPSQARDAIALEAVKSFRRKEDIRRGRAHEIFAEFFNQRPVAIDFIQGGGETTMIGHAMGREWAGESSRFHEFGMISRQALNGGRAGLSTADMQIEGQRLACLAHDTVMTEARSN